jgi:hypothetical protein
MRLCGKCKDGATKMAKYKLADMFGVRSYGNEPGVELWLSETGRLVIVAYNEAGHAATQVDLRDVLDWLQTGQTAEPILGADKPSSIIARVIRTDTPADEAGGNCSSSAPRNWTQFSKRLKMQSRPNSIIWRSRLRSQFRIFVQL